VEEVVDVDMEEEEVAMVVEDQIMDVVVGVEVSISVYVFYRWSTLAFVLGFHYLPK
jgi:hypothetical protein